MKWTRDTGEVVEWDWAQPPVEPTAEPTAEGAQSADGDRYAIKIRINGRRLRGREAQEWKRRIATEFAE